MSYWFCEEFCETKEKNPNNAQPYIMKCCYVLNVCGCVLVAVGTIHTAAAAAAMVHVLVGVG